MSAMFAVRLEQLYMAKDDLDRERGRLNACAEDIRRTLQSIQELSGMEGVADALRAKLEATRRQLTALGELAAAMERITMVYVSRENAVTDAVEILSTRRQSVAWAYNNLSSIRNNMADIKLI